MTMMKRSRVSRHLAVTGLVALLGSGAAAWAQSPARGDQERQAERHRIVVVGPDGEERTIEGRGPLVRRGYLGVGLTDLTPELRAHFGVPEESGVMVSTVEPGSPAAKAGVRVGDIITRLDGKDVKTSWDVRSQVRTFDENAEVPLEVWRNGKVQTLTAAIVKRERPELDVSQFLLRRGEGGGPLVLNLEGDALRERGPHRHRIEVRGPGEPRVRREPSPREAQLERQLRELEKRIAELERQLGKK